MTVLTSGPRYKSDVRFLLPAFLLFISLIWSSPIAAQESEATQTYTEDASDYPAYDTELLKESYREIKRDEAYQFELADAIPPKPRSAFSKWFARVIDAIFRVLGPILKLAFWLGVGALILGVLYLIGRAIYETHYARPAKKTKEDEPDIPLYQPAKAQARILLDEVDRLAAEGKYGEAVHTLLFRSIQDIDRNRPNVVRRSLTAREIGNLTVLTPQSRQAFSTIAGVSELSHFGGTPIGQSGFDIARKAYADLTGHTGEPAARRRRR